MSPETTIRYVHGLFFCRIYKSLHIQTIVSEVSQVAPLFEGEERFSDPRSKTTFAFDHISLVSIVHFHFDPIEPM